MQRRLLKSAYNNASAAIQVLEEMKTQDIKSRRGAKASAKPKWTRRIESTTKTIGALRSVRQVIRAMPKRV